MKRILTAASVTAALALGLFAPPAEAGLLQAIDTAMNNYANNIVKQGEQGINDVKNGSIKNLYNDAWQNYSKSFYEEGMLGGDALKDSKAIFAELKKIVMWVPNKIKEMWAKMVDALKWVRDRIGAAGPGWPPPNAGGGAAVSADIASIPESVDAAVAPEPAADAPAASETAGLVLDVPTEGQVRASAGLGDGFLGKFSGTRDFTKKLGVFTGYQMQVARVRAWFASLKPQEQKALTPNVSKVIEEATAMEDMLSKDVAGNGCDAFVKAANTMDAATARSTIRGLLAKATKRVNMQYLGNKSDKNAARKAQQLATLKVKLGL
ncbi:MAG: hypothetical protein HY816_10780 [Candidatus Wallbacteria bacterium]|nr:hypothetical protein [Candidatus Wallbacteria bacterium]